jgi:hypothetical protein
MGKEGEETEAVLKVRMREEAVERMNKGRGYEEGEGGLSFG